MWLIIGIIILVALGFYIIILNISERGKLNKKELELNYYASKKTSKTEEVAKEEINSSNLKKEKNMPKEDIPKFVRKKAKVKWFKLVKWTIITIVGLLTTLYSAIEEWGTLKTAYYGFIGGDPYSESFINLFLWLLNIITGLVINVGILLLLFFIIERSYPKLEKLFKKHFIE